MDILVDKRLKEAIERAVREDPLIAHKSELVRSLLRSYLKEQGVEIVGRS